MKELITPQTKEEYIATIRSAVTFSELKNITDNLVNFVHNHPENHGFSQSDILQIHSEFKSHKMNPEEKQHQGLFQLSTTVGKIDNIPGSAWKETLRKNMSPGEFEELENLAKTLKGGVSVTDEAGRVARNPT